MRRATPMSLRKGAAALMVTSIVSACTVGPDYIASKTKLVAFHNLNVVAEQRAAAPAPSLDQNLDLAAALARVQQARAAASEAGAQLLPTVDLDASGTAEHQSLNGPLGSIARTLPGYNRDQRAYTFGPAASWEIDLFGGLRRRAKAANDEVQAAEAEDAGTRVTVAADAADA